MGMVGRATPRSGSVPEERRQAIPGRTLHGVPVPGFAADYNDE